MRRSAAVVVSAALLIAGCAAPKQPVDRPAAHPPATRLPSVACDRPTPTGKIQRLGYDLEFHRGSMRVKVRDDRGEECVEFAKWGNPDPEVPPDSLLYSFIGADGEGALLEFLGVDLAGGKLPDTRPLGPLNHAIDATVGVSVRGVYYTSSACRLTLTTSNAERAAGRFDCPRATARTANPFHPSDDVSPEDPAAAPERTAALSGRFDVR